MSKVRDGVLGLCVGDALGVPVEFRSREELAATPLTDMIGYGSHNQPPGTWSDDSSLAFCFMESAADCGGVDLYDIADKFTGWLYKTRWTPHGRVFDVGIATARAIERLNDEIIRPDMAGGRSENSNGNGSLMRILPLAYLLKGVPLEERIAVIRQVSSITHGHEVSVMGCVIYVEVAMGLLDGLSLPDSVARGGHRERRVQRGFRAAAIRSHSEWRTPGRLSGRHSVQRVCGAHVGGQLVVLAERFVV